jgi:hypothetical protein
MYIGPWQEFHLNKSRNSNKEGEKNKLIHQNLVSILENSLNPEAAKLAIQAIDPYLKNVSDNKFSSNQQNSTSSISPSTRLPKVLQRDRRVRGYRHINKRPGQPPRHNQQRQGEGEGQHQNRQLPLILSARSSYDNNGPPSNRSTMSTMSEPIQGTAYTPDKKIPPIRQAKLKAAEKKQPNSTYDTANVLDILKTERVNAEKNNIAQQMQPDFSSYWTWKQQGKQMPASYNIKSAKDNKSKSNKKADISEISKMDRVNKMKEIYSNKDPVNNDMDSSSITSSSSLNSHRNINLSPIKSRPVAVYSKPKTPIVQDKDLTDSDMAVISKYFHKNQPDYNLLSQQRLAVHGQVREQKYGQEISPSAHLTRQQPHQYQHHLVANASRSPQRSRERLIVSPPPRMRTPTTPNNNKLLAMSDSFASSRGGSPAPRTRLSRADSRTTSDTSTNNTSFNNITTSNSNSGSSRYTSEANTNAHATSDPNTTINNDNHHQHTGIYHYRGAVIDIDSSDKCYTDQADEGFMAAEEGLLDWCTNLDVNDVDSMY